MAARLPDELRAVRDDPGHAVLFLDYDGTLAPIVDDPSLAVPWPGVPELLARLGRRLGRVVVVSGRPGEFLSAALGPPAGVELRGVYGMERVGADGVVHVEAEAQRWRPVVDEARRRAGEQAPPGVRVEAKGVTVTLHWRESPPARAWVERFAEQAARDTGLVRQPARMAVELRPPLHMDKGTVVRDVGAKFRVACYFGDDLGDLPAFEALGDLAAGGVAVARVAVADAESPPEVAAAADLVVQGPGGAYQVLEQLTA